MHKNVLSLKVKEAYSHDIGNEIARIDFDSMDSLEVLTYDTIEIMGKQKTVTKCLPLNSSDNGRAIIRIDKTIRTMAKIRIGQYVKVKRIGNHRKI